MVLISAFFCTREGNLTLDKLKYTMKILEYFIRESFHE